MRYKMTSKIFAMVLSVMLTVTMMPVGVFAQVGIGTTADSQMQMQDSGITDAVDTGDTGTETPDDVGVTGDEAKEITDAGQVYGPDDNGADEITDAYLEESDYDDSDVSDSESVPEAAETTVPDTSDYAGGFEMSENVDDVVVTVRAEEGVFPEDAVLSVKKLSRREQKKVDAPALWERITKCGKGVGNQVFCNKKGCDTIKKGNGGGNR